MFGFEEIKAIPTSQPVPKSQLAEAVDAILRAVCGEKDERLRLRNKVLLALLINTGLSAQEVCDVQIRDLDLDGGTVTVRHGKGGRMRRVMLNTEAISLLRRYMPRLRCPGRVPVLGSEIERDSLLVGFALIKVGRPMQPGITSGWCNG